MRLMRVLGIVLLTAFCAYIGHGLAVATSISFALFVFIGGPGIMLTIVGLTLWILALLRRIKWNV